MNLVWIESLAAPRRMASRAVSISTPSISNRMRPGLILATQNSGAPLPEPMRTSAGFFDTGTSGKTRIQTRPARFIWRVMARRAASISRAVMRSGSRALRPYSPKFSDVPPLAAPWMRPLCCLRNLVRDGESIVRFPLWRRGRSGLTRGLVAGLGLFRHALVLGHGVVFHDLALEYPHLDAAGAVGRLRRRHAVIDVGAQRVQRHAAFAVPFHARDLGAAETARAVDTNAFGAEAHRRLHRALHGAAERDAALELLGDRFGDQRGVKFGLADFDNVDDDVGSRDVSDLLA